MSYDFTADDIFGMAEQMEQNGARFYRDASAKSSNAKEKTFLEELARMEDDHKKTFAAMRLELSGKEKTDTVFDPAGEAVLYLKALVDTKVFFEKPINVTAMRDILKSAIEAEKDSIVFYLGMRDAVPKQMGKDKIDGIIKEEMSHVRLLSRELVARGK